MGPLLSYKADSEPGTAVHVTFHTGHVCLGQVEYGATSALGSLAQEGQQARAHKVLLSGLTPGSTWYYRVSCVGAGTSPVFSFHTPSANASQLTFAVVSDTQDDGERGVWSRTAGELAMNHPDVELILAAGDLVWADEPGLWWTFFDKGRDLFASRALMAAVGNHDTPTFGSNPDTSSFESWFDYDGAPTAPLAYRFRFGPALFLALGTEHPGEARPAYRSAIRLRAAGAAGPGRCDLGLRLLAHPALQRGGATLRRDSGSPAT
ncbi:MAG: fibronectin type III domain-containing protein [Myxococcales bacterium]